MRLATKFFAAVLVLLAASVGVYLSPLNMPWELDFEENFQVAAFGQIAEESPIDIYVFWDERCESCFGKVKGFITAQMGMYKNQIEFSDYNLSNDEFGEEYSQFLFGKLLPELESSYTNNLSDLNIDRRFQLPEKGKVPMLPFIIICYQGQPVWGLSIPDENSQQWVDIKAWLANAVRDIPPVHSAAFAGYSREFVDLPMVYALSRESGLYDVYPQAGKSPWFYLSLHGWLTCRLEGWDCWSVNTKPYVGWKEVPLFYWSAVKQYIETCPGGSIPGDLPNSNLKLQGCPAWIEQYKQEMALGQGITVPRIQVPYRGVKEAAGYRGYLIHPENREVSQVVYVLLEFDGRTPAERFLWVPLVRVSVFTEDGLLTDVAVPWQDLEFVGEVGEQFDAASASSPSPDAASVIETIPTPMLINIPGAISVQ